MYNEWAIPQNQGRKRQINAFTSISGKVWPGKIPVSLLRDDLLSAVQSGRVSDAGTSFCNMAMCSCDMKIE